MWLMVLAAHADPLAIANKVEVLPNGLTVIVSEDRSTDAVALHLHYGVGARDEKPGEFGCAHLFEHLMFEGSANVPNNAFDGWLTDAGGDNNAYTSEDETAYHMSFPSGALDVALMLESDRMGFLKAGIDEANVANQRKVVLQERAEGFDEPHGRDWDAVAQISWPAGHGYQHGVIGTIADVQGFEVAGVVDFWERHYRPRNAVLTLVGNLDPDAALEQLRHWFSDVPDPGPVAPRAEVAPLPPPAGDHLLVDPNVEDRTLIMIYPGVEVLNADAPALDVLSYVLSNGRGSRLDDALYYKKSVLTTVSAFSSNSDIAGQMFLYARTDRFPLEKVQKKLDKEMAKFFRAPPTEAELRRAKTNLRSGMLDQIEDLEGRASTLADCYRTMGEGSCLPARLAQYEAVTAADVMRVAKKYLDPSTRATLSVVPKGDTGMIPGAVAVEIP